MVLIAAKMTDRLQVYALLVRDLTIMLVLRIADCIIASLCVVDPLCAVSLLDSRFCGVLDKGYVRRYSERQM